jgi:phage-related protein
MATRLSRILVAGLSAFLIPSTASAAFFWKAPDLRGEPVTGAEPGVLTGPLTGANPDELRAALLWNLRSGLNVAALQCQFAPTLLTRNQYNAMLDNHRDELGKAYQTLTNYFKRTDKKNWQTKLDQYGTRTYSSFSTVLGQYTFCQAAGSIGQEAIFAPKGQLHQVASRRMRELRKSLALAGEQQFVFWVPPQQARLVPLEERCWKKNELRANCRYAVYA